MDEYSQVEGLLTLEDVLEELVGEIQDAYDRPAAAQPIVRREDRSWLVQGTESYDRVREGTGAPPVPAPERGLYTTPAGLVMTRRRRIPAAGDALGLGQGWHPDVLGMAGRPVEGRGLRRRWRL